MTAMPTITFGPDTDTDSLYSLLHYANVGLRVKDSNHRGMTFDFLLTDGGIITGSYVAHGVVDGVDSITINIHEDGYFEDDTITIPTALIYSLTYL